MKIFKLLTFAWIGSQSKYLANITIPVKQFKLIITINPIANNVRDLKNKKKNDSSLVLNTKQIAEKIIWVIKEFR